MGAVGEGIAEAPVAGLGEFAPAFVAGCNVRRNKYRAEFLLDTFPDRKITFAERRKIAPGNVHDFSQGRRIGREVVEKRRYCRVRSLDFDQNTVRRVENKTRQLKTVGQAVHKGTKSHPLNNPADVNSLSNRQRVLNTAGFPSLNHLLNVVGRRRSAGVMLEGDLHGSDLIFADREGHLCPACLKGKCFLFLLHQVGLDGPGCRFRQAQTHL